MSQEKIKQLWQQADRQELLDDHSQVVLPSEEEAERINHVLQGALSCMKKAEKYPGELVDPSLSFVIHDENTYSQVNSDTYDQIRVCVLSDEALATAFSVNQVLNLLFIPRAVLELLEDHHLMAASIHEIRHLHPSQKEKASLVIEAKEEISDLFYNKGIFTRLRKIATTYSMAKEAREAITTNEWDADAAVLSCGLGEEFATAITILLGNIRQELGPNEVADLDPQEFMDSFRQPNGFWEILKAVVAGGDVMASELRHYGAFSANPTLASLLAFSSFPDTGIFNLATRTEQLLAEEAEKKAL